MKKVFLLSFLLLTVASISYCLEPLRISATTTPSVTGDLTIDLLESNGTPLFTAYTEPGRSSGLTGILSVIVDGTTWHNTTYSKDYLVRLTFGTTVLSIERLEVAIAKQSLYGATISSDDIDQTSEISFNSLAVTGDLTVGGCITANSDLVVNGKTTLKKTVGNVKNITLTSNITTIDLGDAINSTLILNITGFSDGNPDVVNITNPISGQMLIIHYYHVSESMTINSAHTMAPNAMRFLIYINSKWHPFTFAPEF